MKPLDLHHNVLCCLWLMAAAGCGNGFAKADAGHADGASNPGSGQDGSPPHLVAGCTSDACNSAPSGLLDPSTPRRGTRGSCPTRQQGIRSAPTSLPLRTALCASVPITSGDATSAIQNALNGCEGQPSGCHPCSRHVQSVDDDHTAIRRGVAGRRVRLDHRDDHSEHRDHQRSRAGIGHRHRARPDLLQLEHRFDRPTAAHG